MQTPLSYSYSYKFKRPVQDNWAEAVRIITMDEEVFACGDSPSTFSFSYGSDDDYPGVLKKIAHLLEDKSYVLIFNDECFELEMCAVLGGEASEVLVLDKDVDKLAAASLARVLKEFEKISPEDLPRVAIEDPTIMGACARARLKELTCPEDNRNTQGS